MTPVSTALGRRNERLHKRPFLVRQIARITQPPSVVTSAILARPHRRPPTNQAASLESQMIPPIQFVLGRALRGADGEALWREHPTRKIDVVAVPLPPMSNMVLPPINRFPQTDMLIAVGFD